MHPARVIALLVAALLPIAACSARNPGADGGLDEAACAHADQTADIAQLESVRVQLESHRTQALPRSSTYLEAQGDYLYWQDTTNLTPTFHRMHGDGTGRVNYTFSIGSGDLANARASNSLVVTARSTGGSIEYRAYDATQPNQLLGTATLPGQSGIQWYAYSVDSIDVYIVQTSTPGTTALMKWTPSTAGAPTQLTTLESAGVTVGEFMDFGVSGNTMVFIESGRIWRMDLAANHAEWLRNMTEVSGTVNFSADGVMFGTATAPMFFTYATGALTNLSTSIAAAPYRINCTFASAHTFTTDFARWGDWMIYIGNEGVFAYNMATHAVRPVLLNTRESPWITYRYPAVLPDGTLYVTGLTSTSGATGAEGPVYRVDLSQILN